MMQPVTASSSPLPNRPLTIGFDGLSITSTPSGVGVASRAILHGLARSEHADRVVAVLPQNSAALPIPEGAGDVRVIEAPVDGPDTPRALFFQHVEMTRALRRAKVDVHLGTSFVLPFSNPNVPEVVIVYDASWRRYPESKSIRFRTYMDRVVPASMRRAAAVVTCSSFTAGECSELEPALPADRLHVVPLGVDARIPPDDPAAHLAALRVPRPFLLSVSNFDPRKNLDRLVAAWRRLRADGRVSHALVLAGHPERAAALRARLRAAPDEPLLTPGYVTDEQLAALYATADAVVVPSLYEGFGFPVLEAYVAGAPVACARAGSLPEVAGDAAEMFDPLDETAMCAAIERVVTDTPGRAGRIARGRAHAADFTWERTAREIRAILAGAVR